MWYSKAAEFWPSNSTSSKSTSSSVLSPASNGDLQQHEDRLSRFLAKFPPLSSKELLQLESFLEKVPDTKQRNQSKLLIHRCKELEKIIRARETHLVVGNGRGGAGDNRKAEVTDLSSRFGLKCNCLFFNEGFERQREINGLKIMLSIQKVTFQFW